MSTLAIGGSEAGVGAFRPGGVLRYLDLALLALALAVFVVAELPIVGYVVIAVAWLVQRGVQMLAERRVATSLAAGERRAAVGVTAMSALGRVWFLAACVLAVGLIGAREDGLAAAVLAAVLFTTRFIALAASRLLSEEGVR